MEFKGIKIYVIIIVMISVIGIFFIGKFLYRVYNIDKPIKEELLALNGVSNVEIVKKEGKADLHLVLLPNQDFFTLYQEIANTMKNKLGSKSGDIIVLNNDESLKEVYHKIHFAIYEGINTSKYVEMESNVKIIAENEGIDNYKIWVDNDAVYIQLNKNDLSFYKRIPNDKSVFTKSIGGDYLG